MPSLKRASVSTGKEREICAIDSKISDNAFLPIKKLSKPIILGWYGSIRGLASLSLFRDSMSTIEAVQEMRSS